MGQRCLQSRRDGAHYRVAADAAQGVVDLTETVGVDQREGDVAARAPALLGQRPLEARGDDPLVGQPGQRVFAGEPAHGFDAAGERAGEPQRRPRGHHGAKHQRYAHRTGKTPQPVHGADQRAVSRPREPADDAALRILQRLHFAAAFRRRIHAEAQVRKPAAPPDQPQRAVVETLSKMVGVPEHWAEFFERVVERDLALGGKPSVVRLRHRKAEHRDRDRREAQQQERHR